MQEQLTYYATGKDTFREGESIFISRAYEEVEPHLHAHDFIEIAYVISGQGIHRIGDIEYSVSKGDLFIINYDVPHEFRSLPSSPQSGLSVYNCIFKPEFLDYALMNCRDFSGITYHFLFKSFFPEENENRADIKLLDQESSDIAEIYEKMFREYTIMDHGYIEILRAYLIELLITIFRKYRSNNPVQDRVDLQRRQIIEKVIRYMKSNYNQDMKLEDLSLMAFLSRNYFCKLFKECTGMTVFEYTQKIRIEEACSLLRKTNRKIIDISCDVGYRDIKFFNQIFKRYTGKTPGEYRKG